MDFESALSSDWSVLSALIDEALGVPTSERAAWLAALPERHAPHRDTLRALLATQADIETDDFLAELPCLPMVDPDAAAHVPPVLQ